MSSLLLGMFLGASCVLVGYMMWPIVRRLVRASLRCRPAAGAGYGVSGGRSGSGGVGDGESDGSTFQHVPLDTGDVAGYNPAVRCDLAPRRTQ